MTPINEIAQRLLRPVPAGRRAFAAQIAGFVLMLAGALMSAGGLSRSWGWASQTGEVTQLPRETDKAGSGEISFTTRLADGRTVLSRERVTPSVLKNLQTGSPLPVRCEAAGDGRCESVRSVTDRLAVGAMFLVTGLALVIIGRWQWKRHAAVQRTG